MPNERIRLEFIEFSPEKAERMLGVARHFAVAKIGGRPGHRAGTLVVCGDWRCLAYWTPSRCVVVKEVPSV